MWVMKSKKIKNMSQRIVTIFVPVKKSMSSSITTIIEYDELFNDVTQFDEVVKKKVVKDEEVIKQISTVYVGANMHTPHIAVTLLLEKADN